MTGIQLALQQLDLIRKLLEATGATESAAYLGTLHALQEVPNEPHCATCQCARIHGMPPDPENPRSKSWHE